MNSQTTGRTRHTHKITVYLSADELHALDTMTAHIRYRLGIRADRGRLVREALALAVWDVDMRSERSWLVERLREIR